RLHLLFDRLSIHRQADIVPAHALTPFTLECASKIARLTTTRVTSRLYSAVPRRSLDGSQAAAASWPARSRLACVSGWPTRRASASSARIGVGLTLVRPMRIAWHTSPAA